MENFNKSKELNGTILVDTKIKVTAVPHVTTIKIRNVPQNITDYDLLKSFYQFGHIKKAYVHVDYDGVPKGKGTVVFRDVESVTAAVAACTDNNFFLHESCIVPLTVTPVKKNKTVEQINNINNDFVIDPLFAITDSARDFNGYLFKSIDDVYEKNKEALQQQKKQSQDKIKEEIESCMSLESLKIY
ncbi:hypothetical protein HCN44_010524 [Aphidius gifuensis]|uniref:RRM domain-containing protein n=2 Tax=Aphidius gifuensis TaxID=684658 RepID=A0A834XQT1_APHGI|nr:hypothetical protein HCN44_010524 [Aphidius gifuensis]